MASGFCRNDEQKQSFPSASARPKNSTLAWPRRAKRNQAAAGASDCTSGAARWNAKMRERSEGGWIRCSPSAMTNPSPAKSSRRRDGFRVSGPKDTLRQQPSNAWRAPINPELRHPGASRGVHFDLAFIGRTSRWIPAFAGMRSKSRASPARPLNQRIPHWRGPTGRSGIRLRPARRAALPARRAGTRRRCAKGRKGNGLDAHPARWRTHPHPILPSKGTASRSPVPRTR